MECERLQRLIKSWYIQVQDETMAPARMASFMENHLAECPTCLADPMVRQEVEKITAIILPPSKVRKPASEEEEEAMEATDDEVSSFDQDSEGDEAEESDEGEEDEEMGDDLMDDEEEDDDL